MRTSLRLQQMPPYLYDRFDKRLQELEQRGVDVISFGAGDPDFPTPAHIVEALRAAVGDPETHHYPSYYGLATLRQAIAEWFGERFGVELDPESEILPLIGSKEGIVHLPLALTNPGDVVLCQDPAYPAYFDGAVLAAAKPVGLDIRSDNSFLPDLERIEPDLAAAAKILWLNFPANPTGAIADLEYFERAIEFCRQHDIWLAHDAAYSEVTYDGHIAPSVLQVPGAREVAVEFHSFSKTYCMTGWRIGWVCGSVSAVSALAQLKTHIDSGIFNALQCAGIVALEGPKDFLQRNLSILASRRDRAVEWLRSSGVNAFSPKASLYLWLPLPNGYDSYTFSELMLSAAKVFVTPGSAYGANGEGFVRLSLCLPDELFDEGLGRFCRAFRQLLAGRA